MKKTLSILIISILIISLLTTVALARPARGKGWKDNNTTTDPASEPAFV